MKTYRNNLFKRTFVGAICASCVWTAVYFGTPSTLKAQGDPGQTQTTPAQPQPTIPMENEGQPQSAVDNRGFNSGWLGLLGLAGLLGLKGRRESYEPHGATRPA